MKNISSRSNPIVKAFRELAVKPDPSGARLLLDGAHLVRDAHAAGMAFEAVVVAASHLDNSEEGDLARTLDQDGVVVIAASQTVFSAVSPVKAPSGVAAIASRRPTDSRSIWSKSNALIVAAVDVQDPGNLGSLLRAGEAGGATGALVCGTSANPFSWKAVRGSMGSILRLPVVAGIDPATIAASAKKAGVRVVAAVPRGGKNPDEVHWTGPVALLLGGEGVGLPESLVAETDERVTLPMAQPVESLNVAVAGAILIYAARRQRA